MSPGTLKSRENMQILIDGYNLMHAIGFRGNLAAPGRLEQVRLEMLDKLASYLAPPLRKKTVVVFDQGHRNEILENLRSSVPNRGPQLGCCQSVRS